MVPYCKDIISKSFLKQGLRCYNSRPLSQTYTYIQQVENLFPCFLEFQIQHLTRNIIDTEKHINNIETNQKKIFSKDITIIYHINNIQHIRCKLLCINIFKQKLIDILYSSAAPTCTNSYRIAS